MNFKHIENIVALIWMIPLFICSGCSKFLDAKPDKKLTVPSTLKDLQALMDYYPRLNGRGPSSLIISADNYYLTSEGFNRISEKQRRMYTWKKNFLFENSFNDWSDVYNAVYYANTVLEKIENIAITTENEEKWKDLKGQAYFFRARSFLWAVWIWAKTYDATSASTDLGIPLRLTTDFNTQSKRATLQQSYNQIINDLERACNLLSVVPVHVMRPSKPAAYAMLARTFLSMRNYPKTLLYADSCLKLHNDLLNYNILNPGISYPFSRFNKEVIFESSVPCPAPLVNSVARVDSELYRSYAPNDLRKVLFFEENKDHSHAFRGSYEQSINLFDGIATDEVLLMKAECLARVDKIAPALKALNKLLKNRYEPGFIPINEQNPQRLIDIILSERRKELLMRGLRWVDLKRLNKEGAKIRLKRIVAGDTFILPPNDPRYSLPIPEDIIKLSGMTQNPR